MQQAKEGLWSASGGFRHRSATPAGIIGNGDARSLGDNVISILGSVVNARADTATASIKAVGGQSARGGGQVKPDEGQLSRPVLRGRGGSNTSLLPGMIDE
jgi:hypothetical protein